MAFSTTKSIRVKQVPGKGLGVFAVCEIAEEELIERCPVLVMSKSDVWQVDSLLSRYVFSWGKGKVALALGYGSLYNHSFRPNAYHQDLGRRCKQFRALRDIAAGEEITINYNGLDDAARPVGFEVID